MAGQNPYITKVRVSLPTRPFTVTFVVESKADPAFERLTALLAVPGGAPARIVVAGEARDCGQKVHNLLVATADRSPEVEVTTRRLWTF